MKRNKRNTRNIRKPVATVKRDGPGRPMADINIPRTKFTFAEFETANPKVTPLTLRKFLKRDAKLGNKSRVVRTDETRDPSSKSGLGRKVFVYVSRERQQVLNAAKRARKAASKPKAQVKAKTVVKAKTKPATAPRKRTPRPAIVAPPVTADVSDDTKSYEAQKAELLTNGATAPAPAAEPTAEATDGAPTAEVTETTDTQETATVS